MKSENKASGLSMSHFLTTSTLNHQLYLDSCQQLIEGYLGECRVHNLRTKKNKLENTVMVHRREQNVFCRNVFFRRKLAAPLSKETVPYGYCETKRL